MMTLCMFASRNIFAHKSVNINVQILYMNFVIDIFMKRSISKLSKNKSIRKFYESSLRQINEITFFTYVGARKNILLKLIYFLYFCLQNICQWKQFPAKINSQKPKISLERIEKENGIPPLHNFLHKIVHFYIIVIWNLCLVYFFMHISE